MILPGDAWKARLLAAALLLLGALALGGSVGGVQAQGTPPKPAAVAPGTVPGCAIVVPAWGIGYPEQLLAASALGDEVWAVGVYQDHGPHLLAQRWDGSAWTDRTPPDGMDPSLLSGVAVAGPNDVWAVGTSRRTEHWDGTRWTLVPNPSPESLKAIVALSSEDVWAAGGITIIHWNGLAWSLVPHPAVAGGLTAIAARAGDDVWAIGDTDILHWDGTAWAQVPNPPGGSLVSVTAPAASDAWAVGSVAGSGGTAPIIEHWDGTAWSVAPFPPLTTTNNVLTGIAAGAANDVWAVGKGYGDSDIQTLVLHWDGSAWSVVPSGNADLDDNRLFAVTAPAPGIMWAVGAYQRWDHGYDTALTLHYTATCPPPSPPPCDGAFHIVPSPNVYNDAGYLYGVAAPAPNDAWAVGASHPGGAALLIHWDGQRWSRGTPPENKGLYAISARTAADIWAVGDQIIHWNGAQWARVPDPPGLTGPLRGVVARAAADAWAVGGNQILHWDGSAWSLNPTTGAFQLNAVAAIAANDAWAVGNTIMHWDGNTWQAIPAPPDVIYHGIAAVGAHDVWAVGSTTSAISPRQRIVHWDGAAWTVDPQINAYGTFNAVLARSANDVWVAGSVNYGSIYDAYPAVMHWDGRTWATVDAPWPTTIRGSVFAALAGVPGGGDLWATGTSALADSLTERLQPSCWDGD